MGTSSPPGSDMLKLVLACVLVALSFTSTDAAPCNTKVCEKFYNGVLEMCDAKCMKDEEKVENKITKWCKANKTRPFDKMCYYIEGIKRKISKDIMQGAPAELACKRLGQKDQGICELKEPRQLDKNIDLDKMRVKQLRELMQEYGVDCPNCLEKSDMVKRIKATILSDKKEL